MEQCSAGVAVAISYFQYIENTFFFELGVVELQTKAWQTKQSGGSSLIRHVDAESFSELTDSERSAGKSDPQPLKWIDLEELMGNSLCMKEWRKIIKTYYIGA